MDGADEEMLPREEKAAVPESKVELADVKFTNNEKQNGDAKLDIGMLYMYIIRRNNMLEIFPFR